LAINHLYLSTLSLPHRHPCPAQWVGDLLLLKEEEEQEEEEVVVVEEEGLYLRIETRKRVQTNEELYLRFKG